jgi:hypothetical protein
LGARGGGLSRGRGEAWIEPRGIEVGGGLSLAVGLLGIGVSICRSTANMLVIGVVSLA